MRRRARPAPGRPDPWTEGEMAALGLVEEAFGAVEIVAGAPVPRCSSCGRASSSRARVPPAGLEAACPRCVNAAAERALEALARWTSW